jgi:hypothetical protein
MILFKRHNNIPSIGARVALYAIVSMLLLSALFPHQSISQETIQIDTVSVNPALPRFVVTASNVNKQPDSAWISIHQEGDSIELQSFSTNPTYGSSDFYFTDLNFVDINFDGYIDLQLKGSEGMGMESPRSYFWLFNPQSGLFEESEEYSDFDDLDIDTVEHQITSTASSAGNNKWVESKVFNVIDHHIDLVEQEESHEYSTEKKILINDSMTVISRSSAKTIHDSLSFVPGDVQQADLVVVTYEDTALGQLRTVKKVYQRYYSGPVSRDLDKKEIEIQTEWGTFRIEKEITYNYMIDESNVLSVDEAERRVEDGQWQAAVHRKQRIPK